MSNLALYYMFLGDYHNAIKYNLMAIEKNHIKSMNNIALCYKNIGDDKNKLKYYLMSIEKGDIIPSMYNLGIDYKNNGDNENAIKYFSMIVENEKNRGSDETLYEYSLGNMNYCIKNYNKLEMYFKYFKYLTPENVNECFELYDEYLENKKIE